MLDQSFSAENFRKLYDLANRKGIHVADKLSMSKIREFNKKIKDCNTEIKAKRKAKDHAAVKVLQEIKKDLVKQKDDALQIELEEVSQKIAAKNFRVKLKKIEVPEKPLYTIPNTPEHFFAIHQTQRNIERLFGVKQANRHTIVKQVISLLGDQFPKVVIRTDIQTFYESIPHKPLLQKIHKDNLLTPFSRNILAGILKSYKKESGSDKGVPRGIGVSAYLAELFMREIDNGIQELKGVTYYARYVDDIIILFTPSTTEEDRNYLQEVKDIIEKEQEMHINENDKTKVIDLRESNKSCRFNYLGYNIQLKDGAVVTRLTSNKIKKYRMRVESSFNHYLKLSKINEKAARRILVKRIRFLTGNTRLKNNKKNILIGIYYSNKYLTEPEFRQLSRLDGFLQNEIGSKIPAGHDRLEEKLTDCCFKEGYETKRFYPFTNSELLEIMEIWKKPYQNGK